GWFHASFPLVAPDAAFDAPPQAAPYERGGYGEQGRPNLKCILTVIAVHAVVLVGLVKADVIPIRQKAPPPLVVDLVAEPPAPPPPPAAPEPQVKQIQPVQPVIVSPPPLVATPAPPPPVAVVAEAPPPQAVVVAPVAKAAVASAPVSVDLSSKMVSGDPPRYPTESRRKREEGTVVLRLTLAVDGSVADIGVAQGSGFERLDKAALAAVRRWRWSPTMVGGEPVQVRGLVRIPFALTN
ncbi:MAG: energy transducer TonB, partial [Sphingomonas sp.]